MVSEAVRYRDLLIFDDILPSDFSPFRTLEYAHYLSFFDAALVSLEGWHLWVSNENFDSHIEKLSMDRPAKERIERIADVDNIAARLAYVTFLGNAIRLIDFFELRKLSFIFQLYPGGGFEMNSDSADEKLRRVLLSPLCRKVIVT